MYTDYKNDLVEVGTKVAFNQSGAVKIGTVIAINRRKDGWEYSGPPDYRERVPKYRYEVLIEHLYSSRDIHGGKNEEKEISKVKRIENIAVV